MIIADRFTVRAPIAKTWDFLVDIPTMSACIPGVEQVKEESPGHYSGVVKVKVGPIGVAFGGSMEMVEVEPPRRILINAEGKDRLTGSTVTARMTAQLEPQPDDATAVTFEMDVMLRGRLGQLGGAVVQATAKLITRQFATCVASRVES